MTKTTPFDALPQLYDDFTMVVDQANPAITRWVTSQIRTLAHGQALDIGSGTGRYTVVLARHSRWVTGYDISPAMTRFATHHRQTPNVDYITGDGLSAPQSGSFDTLLSTFTAHHLGPADKTLPALRAMLKPDGAAIIVDVVDASGRWADPQWHIDVRAVATRDHIHATTGSVSYADRAYQLLTHPDWLSRVVSDTPLTPKEFRSQYAAAFPLAEFAELTSDIMGVSWDGQQWLNGGLKPGSAEAVAQGCRCPVLDNNHGKRAPNPPNGWWLSADCPLHGMERHNRG